WRSPGIELPVQVEMTTLSPELAAHAQGFRRPFNRPCEVQKTSHIFTLQHAPELCHVERLEPQREICWLRAAWQRAVSAQQRLRGLQAQGYQAYGSRVALDHSLHCLQ